MKSAQICDKKFLWLTVVLVATGLLFFFSGAFFLFSGKSTLFWGTVYRHVGLGIVGALVSYIIIRYIPVRQITRFAPAAGIISVCIAMLVFIPGLAETHGRTFTRWITIGGFSFQPAEFLKIGAVLMYAWWLAKYRAHISTIKYGLLPLIIITSVVGVVMLLQPDTDGFLVIAGSLLLMYLFAGASWRHVLSCIAVAALLLGGLILTRPYLRDRVTTFINPASDPLGKSYHVRQSIIAIGAGGVTGRGYGQGIHKYQYLPEPMGDTIFAVIGEEIGFIGTAFVVVLFFLWYTRGVVLAVLVQTFFSRFVIFGLVHVIAIQALLNISSNIGLFPFSGLPLPFMSQGGTALFIAIVSVGVILKASENYNNRSKV